MTATTKSKTFFTSEFGIIISAAHVSALAGLTTAERISFEIVMNQLNQTQVSERGHSETHVTQSSTPLVSIGPASAEVYQATLVYTEGETLGTDNLDPYEDILEPLYILDPPLPVQFYWQVDDVNSTIEHVTSSTESYIKSLGKPVGGATSDKIMIPFSFVCPPITPSAVA